MADAIKIPSPSALLRPDSPQSLPASATAPAPPLDERPAKSSRHERKVSSPTQVSKKASRKGNPATAASGDGAPLKPKQTKSRNGCVTCKIKRLKCDEEKPGCKQCARRKVECGGYRKEYKWCPFEETTVKQVVDRQKPPPSPPNQDSSQTSKTATPTEERAADASILNAIALANKITRQPTPGAQLELPQRPAPARAATTPASNKNKINNNSDGNSNNKSQALSPTRPQALSPSKGPSGARIKKTASNSDTQKVLSDDEDRGEGCSNELLPTDTQSPTLTEILQPFEEDLTDELSIDGEGNFNDAQMMFQNWYPLEGPLSDLFSFDPILSSLQDTKKEVSTEQAQEAWASRYSSPTNSTSTVSSDGFSASWPTPTSFLFNQPGFAHDSPEALARRFLTVTCPILSIMDGPTENPWRTLIWPLAMQSPALYHAITAMTAYHASSDIKSLHRVGLYHKHQSIKHVMEGIQYKSMKEEAAIATAIALGFSESWEQPIVSGNTHIKGAQVLVKDALASHRRQPRKGPALALLKFLCNAWVYMDVLARLTAVDSDDSEDFDSTLLFSADGPGIVMGKPGFGIDFGMPIDARLDPLMGCANTLFPLIGRVANVVRRVCRCPKNSPAIIETANELKLSLEAWEPPEFIEQPEDPTTQLQHALQTAEAYRWATLLHLQQSVPELPSSCSDEELAEEVMSRLATVPTASRTLIVQVYPLMVAGVLAENPEDRAWVNKRWSAMGQRMRIGVIDKCLLVSKEVWRRRDKYRSTPQGQRKIIKTSELHPVRRNGAPLKRSRDEPDEAPGQSGIVFSWIESDSGGNGGGGTQGSRPPSSAGPGGNRRPGSNLEWYAPYSVRGHLHWIGVMWDWGWEVLLGG